MSTKSVKKDQAQTGTAALSSTTKGRAGASARATSAASSRRLIAWIAIIAATVSLLAVSVFDQGGIENDAERMQRLSESYACPVCQGQSVAESNAEVARTIRQQIRTEVQQDATDDEIRDTLISQYGGEVLLNPPAEGVGSLVWILPVLVVVLGSTVVGAAVTGRSSISGREASDDDRRLVADALETDADSDGTDTAETDTEETDTAETDTAETDSEETDTAETDTAETELDNSGDVSGAADDSDTTEDVDTTEDLDGEEE